MSVPSIHGVLRLDRFSMGYGDEAALAWWDKGREFMERGDWPSATHAFRTAVSIDREFGEAYAGLGAALGNQFLWSLAVEAHTRAAVLLPDDLDTAYNLGVAYAELSRTHEAEVCFRRVLAMRPRDAETLLRLGVELAVQDRFAEAEEVLRAALDAEPTDTVASSVWAFLAMALANQERDEEARAALECARAIHPSLFEERPDFAQLWTELLVGRTNSESR
jgi:tetratricopeptide (TPR) repeat protein